MRARIAAAVLLALAAPPARAAGPWYADPKLALVPGSQSVVGPRQTAAILKDAGVDGKDGLKDAARLRQWLEDSFESSASGGGSVGKSTAESLLASRALTGCHDWALMLSTLLRAAGYPALMVDAAGTQWMEAVRSGRPIADYMGHVFVETFIAGRWVLIEPVSGRYIPDYSPDDPTIPMKVGDQLSYRVMFKGIDPRAYGVHSAAELDASMVRFSRSTDTARPRTPAYRILDLPGGAPLPPLSDAILSGPCPLDPRRHGVVLQFPKAGFDVHAEKADGSYLARVYRYGHVFDGQAVKAVAFPALAGLKRYLRSMEASE